MNQRSTGGNVMLLVNRRARWETMLFRIVGSAVAVAAMAVAFPEEASAGGQVPPTNEGYIFIDGEYVPPPYDIEWTQQTLVINGRQFDQGMFDLTRYRQDGDWKDSDLVTKKKKRRARGRGRSSPKASIEDGVVGAEVRQASLRPSGGGKSKKSKRASENLPFKRFCSEFDGVRSGTVAVLFEQEAPLFLHPVSGATEVIESLYDPSQAFTPQSSWVSSAAEYEVWARLMSEFQPSPEFSERAELLVQRSRDASSEGEQAMAGSFWIDKVSYPLTVFAMAVVVLGFGHLLNHKPKVESDGESKGDWSEQRKVVGQSVLIIGLLSAVDLILTIGTANAGMMRELNPFGSGFIDDPVRLFFFKASLTAASVGILYWLHRRPIAQMAAWWCCLLLTLLTARWVVFQSMFL